MNCRLYLIRHGETEWNKSMRRQGHTDVPLNEKGREQARLLSRRLAHVPLAAFYASDLRRAFETALILAEPHGKTVNPLPALREINFGAWEGLTTEEIKEKYHDEILQWWTNPLQTRIPQGENLAEVVDRVMNAVRDICRRHQGQQVAVVAHGGTIRSIVGTVLGIDLNEYWRLRQDNTGLTIIDFPTLEKGILMLFNDCSHLGPGLVPPLE